MVEVSAFDTQRGDLDCAGDQDLSHAYRAVDAGEGTSAVHLLVEGVHCANCIARIERSLTAREDVLEARVNFSTRRLYVRWRGGREIAGQIVEVVEALGR